jgi:hypothetical protein
MTLRIYAGIAGIRRSGVPSEPRDSRAVPPRVTSEINVLKLQRPNRDAGPSGTIAKNRQTRSAF